MKRHLTAHKWAWLLTAVAVVIANELVDRNFFDHREHLDGDVIVTLGVLVIAFFGSYAASRRAAALNGPKARD